MTIDQIPVKGGEPIPEGGSARYLSGEEINAIVAQIKENRTACEQINSILSSLTTIGNAITDLQDANTELLARMRGTSDSYRGDLDPILRKSYPINAPEGVDTYKYAIKQANEYLNNAYFAISNDKYYRGAKNGAPKEIDITVLRTICQGVIHIDITGGCVWVMNMPFSFATGSFRQIAYGAEKYTSAESGYEVTDGIRAGSQVLQRLSTYDWETGEVSWTEWAKINV